MKAIVLTPLHEKTSHRNPYWFAITSLCHRYHGSAVGVSGDRSPRTMRFDVTLTYTAEDGATATVKQAVARARVESDDSFIGRVNTVVSKMAKRCKENADEPPEQPHNIALALAIQDLAAAINEDHPDTRLTLINNAMKRLQTRSTT